MSRLGTVRSWVLEYALLTAAIVIPGSVAQAQVLTRAVASANGLEIVDSDQNDIAAASAADRGSAQATAYGSLASGKTGAYASAGLSDTAVAQSRLTEQLSFKVAGATPSTVTPIRFTFALDGTIDVERTGLYYYGHQLSLTGTGIRTTSAYYDLLTSNYQTGRETSGGWDFLSYSGSGPSRLITGVFNIYGDTGNIAVSSNLILFASGATTDFSHTASIGLSVPANVTWTSQSGTFLSAVPEPASWAMMLAGFGLIGGVIRTGRASSGARHRVRVARL